MGQEDLLWEEMATHSGILAWKIPWTEEPGWLQSKGSQRVGQDQLNTHTHTHTHTRRQGQTSAEAWVWGFAWLLVLFVYMPWNPDIPRSLLFGRKM